jgi:uncharacterized protein
MKILHIVAWVLLIIGGLNWGLVGVADVDLVAKIFGAGSVLSRIIYILIGLSGIYGIYACSTCKDKCSS